MSVGDLGDAKIVIMHIRVGEVLVSHAHTPWSAGRERAALSAACSTRSAPHGRVSAVARGIIETVQVIIVCISSL